MLEYLRFAMDSGYGVMVLNPNCNSVTLPATSNGGEGGGAAAAGGARKIQIPDSSSPEEHTLGVWDNLVAASAAREVYLLAYGNGSTLAKDIMLRQLVR